MRVFLKLAPFKLSVRESPKFPTLVLIAILLATTLCITHLQAQQQQDTDEDVVRVDSELVVLNVTVMDKQRHFIHKLARPDFKIFEDGLEQRISLFSVEETPFAAAILLDTSGSMERRITLARAAAIRFLDGLREEDVASIYHFDSEVKQLQDFSPGRDLPPMAYGLNSKGMTTLNDAILRAAKDLAQRPEKRRAIIVLSDGMDTKSAATAEKALNEALKANASIYTVDMMDPLVTGMERMKAAGALKGFANKSGGLYVSSPGGRALDEAFEEILEELSNQYTIGYHPLNRVRDGRWRKIELKLTRPELITRTRDGYHAPKN